MRDTVVRECERDLSPMSVTKQRPGQRYQGGGLVLNEPKRRRNLNRTP
jgi:hypothetical protein